VREDRQRRELGRSTRLCGICSGAEMVIIESRAVRRGVDRLNPRFDPAIRTYELCRGCGAKHHLRNGQPV
jgi:hypothetical protein